MAMNKLILTIPALLFLAFSSVAQKVTYTEPDRDDSRRTDFDIVGKVGGNYLIYKRNRNNEVVAVYDADMKSIGKVNLNEPKQKWINVDFIPYPDDAWMIYQYQQKNVVYCMAIKLDGNGKMLTKPIELDTSRIGFAADNKIYTTIYSDDRKKIMVFKINSKDPKNFVFTTMLFDDQLQPLDRKQINMPMEERNDYFTDFLLDDDGAMVFGKYVRKGGGDYITNLRLITKVPGADDFTIHDMKTGDRVLDDIKIKIDNTNKRYLFSSLYYKQKRGNIEGLYTVTWDRGSSSIIQERLLPFSDELRGQAKGPDANQRTAFNDFFIRNIIVKRDGGYLIIAESQYTTSRGGGPFNRWDYMGFNNPWISPYNYYYSPYYYNSFASPYYNRWGSSPSRYHSENIVVMSFNRFDTLQWSNVVSKTQFDDQTDAMISHQIMNTGGELHFLFNMYERRTMLLNDQSIDANGRIVRNPTFKNLDRDIQFMPRFGKQVSAKSMIIPCQFRNYLIFAKIDF